MPSVGRTYASTLTHWPVLYFWRDSIIIHHPGHLEVGQIACTVAHLVPNSSAIQLKTDELAGRFIERQEEEGVLIE